MGNPKTPEKQPERLYKIHGFTVTKADYRKYWDELRRLREIETLLRSVCRAQNGASRRW